MEPFTMLCAKAGYSCEADQAIVEIRTPVDAWRLDTNTPPIRVNHMHLNENDSQFHRQPRVFLSLYDTFAYIRRYDQQIMNRAQAQEDEPE